MIRVEDKLAILFDLPIAIIQIQYLHIYIILRLSSVFSHYNVYVCVTERVELPSSC